MTKHAVPSTSWMRAFIACGLAATALAGCCHRRMVYQSPAVSMTSSNYPRTVSQGKPVTAKWCHGDPVVTGDDDKDIGMMDQVIMKAQKSAGHTPFILDATIYEECSCMDIKGFAVAGAKGSGKGRRR